jgi:hypothetical protein
MEKNMKNFVAFTKIHFPDSFFLVLFVVILAPADFTIFPPKNK